MNDKLAFKDLLESLESVPGLEAYAEAGKSGSREFSIEAVHNGQEIIPAFGAKKVRNLYELTLKKKGKAQPEEVAQKLGEIYDAITSDRRRGGYAQTTVTGEWTTDTQDERAGVVATSTIEIHTIETC